MHPRMILIVLFSSVFRLNSAWRLELVDQNWKITGHRQTPDGSFDLNVRMTNHMTDQQPDQQADLNRRMNILVQFFQDHNDEIRETKREQSELFVSRSGWTKSERSEVVLEILVGQAIFDLVPGQGRLMIAFDLDDRTNQWKLTHFGPFGDPHWDRYDNALNAEVLLLRNQLVGSLNYAAPHIHERLELAHGRLVVGERERERAVERALEQRRQFNAAIDIINRIPNIIQIEQRAEYLNQEAAPPPYNIAFNPPAVPPPFTRHRQNLLDLLIPHNVRGIYREVNTIGYAASLSGGAWGKPNERILLEAINAQRRVPAQQGNVEARQAGRKKRSTEPVTKNLSANLQLIDADPVSDFVITKIVFKEIYGDKEETHTMDFEKKALIEDRSPSGSRLKAEFLVDGEIVPAEMEKSEQVETISIVLRPRGN